MGEAVRASWWLTWAQTSEVQAFGENKDLYFSQKVIEPAEQVYLTSDLGHCE